MSPRCTSAGMIGAGRLGKVRARWWALSLAALALGLLVAPLAGAQPAKVPRVGLLGVGSAGPSSFRDGLRQGLRELGYVEGQSIVFEDRSTVDRYSRLSEAAAELVRLKVGVIVANGVTAAHAARKVTTTIPIVMGGGADPVEAGLAASLARPGGNVTGLTGMTVELIGKRVELLKEVLPGLSRIGALWDPESRMEPLSLKATEVAARSLGVQVQAVEVRRREDLETAFATLVGQRAEAFFQVPSNLLQAHRARVAELAARHRLPSIFAAKEYVEAGGLMSYGPDTRDLWRRAATHVDRILKGAQPGDLPFERPTKFELVINLKTAKTLGLIIPPSVLARADERIE